MGGTNMTNRKRRSAITIGLFLFGSIVSINSRTAVGQDAFDTVIEFRGKLKDVRRNIMTVTRDDGTDVAVMLHEDPTRLVFSANAKPQWLRAGMLVRVESMFGPEGKPPAPIDKIEIFQPFQASKLSAAQRELFMPGIHSLDNPAGHAPAKAQGFQPGKYRVVGTVAGVGPAGIMINAVQAQVPIPVSPDVKCLIRFNNLSLAEAGDVVQVSGFHQPPDETKVKASDVRVVVDRIYGETPENPRMKRRTKEKEPEPKAPAEKEPPAEKEASAEKAE
jgi:hypothetical protein